jgi:prepilin-type processing-associated H-X9-DG protein
MKHNINFAKKDVVVVLGCVVFLLMNLAAVAPGGRERAKRTVCLANLKQLTAAWNLYADDYEGNIVNGNTHSGEKGAWAYHEDSWPPSDPLNPNDQRINGIKNGALYRYLKDIKLYKCPTGVRGEALTYAIVDSMNGHDAISGATSDRLKNRTQIRNTTSQIVFIDEGVAFSSSWTVYYYKEQWWDKIPCRHSDGTDFGFADGHSEYWKWKDPRTIKIGRSQYDPPLTPPVNDLYWGKGNEDLHRVQIGVWGGLGYLP